MRNSDHAQRHTEPLAIIRRLSRSPHARSCGVGRGVCSHTFAFAQKANGTYRLIALKLGRGISLPRYTVMTSTLRPRRLAALH